MRALSLFAAIPAVAFSTTCLRAEPPSMPPPVAATIVARSAPAEAAAAAAAAESVASPAASAAVAAPSKSETPAAAAPRPAAPSTTLVARINLSTQRLEVTYDGQMQHSWAISSGRAGYATPRGTYRPQWTARMWYSRKYDNAPMPHAVFFTGGVAVHATQSIGLLGHPASHGCVRLAPANAARFYSLVHKHGLKSTRIEVFGTPPVAQVARRAPRGEAVRQAGRSQPRRATASGYGWGWPEPQRAVQPQLARRSSNGIVYLSPSSPYRGRESFVLNGVTYVKVR
ncbi:MAG: L,D-transpeptidase [Hyphomicrobiaceae bacterium]|nr:L,D-transpeptidase [Hyphomicrobiaceae bacterium]